MKNVPKSQEYFWTPEWQERIKESEKNLEEGNYKVFNTLEELFAHLDSLGSADEE